MHSIEGESMRVLIIPSWYPNENNKVSGIFTKEQALTISKLRKEWRIGISLWGQGENFLFLRNPLEAYSKYRNDRKKKTTSIRNVEHNCMEFLHSCLEWSPRLFNGNMREVILANEKNLLSAQEKFGGIDILHAHVSYPAGWIAKLLSNKYNIPYVITEHMSPFPFERYLKNKALSTKVKEPLKEANAIIAVSPYLAQEMLDYGLPEPVIIPNVIDESFFLPDPLEKKTTGSYTFFTLGGLIPQKGIQELLEGIDLLMKRLPMKERKSLVFNIGGAGEEDAKLKKFSEENDLSKNIRWLGSLTREEARYHFRNCDSFVLTSRHESFGVVYAEAMACGKPVIATKCGGPESFINRENGILVEVGKPDQIANALEAMLRNTSSFNSQVIRESFLSRFSSEVVVQKIETLYRDIINRNPNECLP